MALPIVLTEAKARAMGILIEPLPKKGRRKQPVVAAPRRKAVGSSVSFNRFAQEVALHADKPLIHRCASLLLKTYGQSPGQAVLSLAFLLEFGDKVRLEFKPLQGRMIRLDIALPDSMVAIEVNGWSNHGKTLDAFRTDHLRTRDLMAAGWVIVPFTATEARSEPALCVAFIRSFLERRGAMR